MKLIYFNLIDKPENIGQSQLIESIEQFIQERKDILKDAYIDGNKLIFLKGVDLDNNAIYGYALIFDVPNDFNN